jgi:integrase
MKTNHSVELLDNETVRRWYNNIKAKSLISADIRLRTLKFYCRENNISPMDIVEQAKSNVLRNNFEDFVRKLEAEGKAGSYISKFKILLRNWLKYNDIDYPLDRVNIKNEDKSPKTWDEKIPEKDELAKIFRFASPRTKVSIAIMAYSGVRPETLGNYDGSDGLMIKDLYDFDVNTLKFKESPSRLLVRDSLSKKRNHYFTYIPPEAQKYIEEYLLFRRENDHEEITQESPLIQIDLRGQFSSNEQANGEKLKQRKSGHKFLRTMLITRQIKEAFRNAGFDKFRPYVLRAYFISQLDVAESEMVISHPWRLFFSGHTGDISSRYAVNKGRLPDETLRKMKESYVKCIKYLCVESVNEPVRSHNDVVSDEEKVAIWANTSLNVDLMRVLFKKAMEDPALKKDFEELLKRNNETL